MLPKFPEPLYMQICEVCSCYLPPEVYQDFENICRDCTENLSLVDLDKVVNGWHNEMKDE